MAPNSKPRCDRAAGHPQIVCNGDRLQHGVRSAVPLHVASKPEDIAQVGHAAISATSPASCQFGEEYRSVFQSGVSKPSVMAWYPHLRPGSPISRHASGLLLPGDAQGFAVQLFGVLRTPLRQQQLALAPVQLRCELALSCSLRQLQGIVQQAQALLDLTQDFTWSRAKGGMAKLWELRAATSLARLWGEQGRRGEACDLLAPVYGSWAELKNGNVAEGRSFIVCQPKLCSRLRFSPLPHCRS